MSINAVMATLGVAASLVIPGIPGQHAQTKAQSTRPKVVTASKVTASAPQPPQPVMVSVEPGDSLVTIASDHQTTYVRIYDANEQITDPNVIYPGQQLRIPTADEQLADRPLPQAVAAPVAVAAVAPSYSYTAAASTPRAATPVSYSADGTNWDALSQCEAGGNWATNTGNGYYGGLQFTQSSWNAVGGSGLPSDASREEQIARAQMLAARSGMGSWPACSAKLGM
jgi:LysM repeat protein